jgi:curved DNA-binding protein CbpA
MKKITKSFIRSKPKYPLGDLSPPSPPPPPPPLKFDVIIAQVYGPSANIYKDIFAVSPTASQEELKDAYLRIRNQTHAKLSLSNDSSSGSKSLFKAKDRNKKANQRKNLYMQLNAISEAYQIVIDVQKKKEYDKSIIGLKDQVSEVLSVNADEFPGDEQHNSGIDVTSAHHVDLNSRMNDYLKDKHTDERCGFPGGGDEQDISAINVMSAHHADLLKSRMEEYLKEKQGSERRIGPENSDFVTTKEDKANHKVQFALQSLGAPSPEEVKKAVAITPDEKASPIARVRQNEEQRDDQEDTLSVFASYLNLKTFDIFTDISNEDDERTNFTDAFTVEGEDGWSSDGTVKTSHCYNALGIVDFVEEVMAKASNIADGLCQ